MAVWRDKANKPGTKKLETPEPRPADVLSGLAASQPQSGRPRVRARPAAGTVNTAMQVPVSWRRGWGRLAGRLYMFAEQRVAGATVMMPLQRCGIVQLKSIHLEPPHDLTTSFANKGAAVDTTFC